MKGKTVILSTALLSVWAMALLPSAAMAEEEPRFETAPAVVLPSYPTSFTSTGEESVIYAGTFQFTCTSHTISGQFLTARRGELSIVFEGCKDSVFGSECTTSGHSSGTISTGALTFHTVYLKPEDPEKPHERPGIAITSQHPTSQFAKFECTKDKGKEEEVRFPVKLNGSGLLGTVTKPEIGGEGSNSVELALTATAEGQQHVETVEGEEFGLNVKYDGKTTQSVYGQVGTDSLTLAEESKATTITGASSFEAETPTFEETPALSLPSYPAAFTSTGGEGVWSSESSSFSCESTTGSGEFTSAHTGRISIRFEGCKESVFNTACTTTDLEAGTIEAEELTFHTVYLGAEEPGILIAPNPITEGVTEFKCTGGLVLVTVKGSGVLGTVTEPEIEGGGSHTVKFAVEATEEGQAHTETIEGQEYPGWEASVNGGEFTPTYLNAGESTLTFDEPEVEGETTAETP